MFRSFIVISTCSIDRENMGCVLVKYKWLNLNIKIATSIRKTISNCWDLVPNVWEGVQQHVWWLWFALYDSLPSLKQLSDESWNQLNPQVQTFNITLVYLYVVWGKVWSLSDFHPCGRWNSLVIQALPTLYKTKIGKLTLEICKKLRIHKQGRSFGWNQCVGHGL